MPENIPKTKEVINNVFKEWGHDGICFRRVNDVNNVSAKLKNLKNDRDYLPSLLQLFQHLFPESYLQDVMVKQTNKKINGKKMTYGEMVRYFGLWLFMETVSFSNRRDFWSTKSIDEFDGVPYRLGVYMSRKRFE